MGLPVSEPPADSRSRASSAGESARVAASQPTGALEPRTMRGCDRDELIVDESHAHLGVAARDGRGGDDRVEVLDRVGRGARSTSRPSTSAAP